MTLAMDSTAVTNQDATATPAVIEIPKDMPTVPVGFDTTLWALLKSIRDAGVPLKGKIAEYAGFYYKTVNGASERHWDATTNNKNNHDWPLSTKASFIKDSPHTKMQVESGIGIFPGLYVAGDGIASGTTVVSISLLTVTLSTTNTSTKTEVTLDFTTQSPTTGLPLQPNKSLDKLTFMIMFRLPFSNDINTGFSYYGNPDDNSVAYGDPNHKVQSWTYRGNQLRVDPLRKLNDAGEQLNTSNQRCDDSGNPIADATTGELSTQEAFLYYNDIGADLEGSVETAVKNQPLYYYLSITTEGSFLPPATVTVATVPEDTIIQVSSTKNIKIKDSVEFRSGTHSSPRVIKSKTSNTITLTEKIGFAYPVGSKIEIGTDVVFRTLSIVQTPRNIYGLMGKNATGSDLFKLPKAIRRRREVELGTYSATGNVFTPDTSAVANDGDKITKEIIGTLKRYYIKSTTPKKYVRLKYDAEELALNGVHTIGATVFEMDGLEIKKDAVAGTYYAAYYTTNNAKYKFGFLGDGDIQLDNLTILDKSGVTMGWGKDIGQGLRSQYQYNIKFRILVRAPLQPATATHFVLRYKDRASGPISFTALESVVKTALLDLLVLKESALPTNSVMVSSIINSGIAGYTKGWDITIPHINMVEAANASSFPEIYSSNIFYQKSTEKVANIEVEPVPNILIDPKLERDRWKLHTRYDSNGNDTVAKAWETFTNLLRDLCGGDWKLQFAVDPTPDGLTPAEQAAKEAKDTADRDDFEALLRSCYNISRGNAFLPVFNQYTFMDRFRLPDHDLLFPRWVKYVMEPGYYTPTKNKVPNDIRARMNAADSYVLMTVAYGAPGASDSLLNEAIKTKSLAKLVKLVEGRNQQNENRRKIIVENLKKHFKQHLYRNIEED